MPPQEEASDSKEQFRQLRNAIINKPPYCSGTVPVQADELLIYYVKPEAHDDNARRINPLTASPSALEHLADACEPATFGLNDEDVLDESYRKAGKLDAHDFSVRLDLERNGLLDIVRAQLLAGRDTDEDVYAELYKLNVYGEGSFFKPHRDTPRSEAMLGTLVIIYPTRHEGGALIFRDGNEEWTF
ncbi:hypothetical protein NM688_g7337 [Phlebia brevispora]|uniref:Uncharacterized protein n=1 Tax=Phlebia brevispora TaxID=194682 RepID=A0ACC1S6I2_9APHY|nr:hypothetical protein NM688_g7337 [Phlebia brevispora]